VAMSEEYEIATSIREKGLSKRERQRIPELFQQKMKYRRVKGIQSARIAISGNSLESRLWIG
jgi:hypothetical protein